jgi:hypothetical protein
MSVQQEVGQSRVTAGVDWASQDHAVAVVDVDVVLRQRFAVSHTAADLRRMVRELRRAGSAKSPSSGPTAQSSTP